MKKSTLLIVFFLFSISLFAQEDITEPYTRQIGVNMSGLFSTFLNFSGTSSSPPPEYILFYKKKNNQGNFRLGFGGDYSISGKDLGSRTFINLNFSLGREKEKRIAKRWNINYGWDIKSFYTFQKIGSIDNSATQAGIGFSPLFGVQFKIIPRLWLSSELSYTFYIDMQDKNGETFFGSSAQFYPPTSIFLYYRF